MRLILFLNKDETKMLVHTGAGNKCLNVGNSDIIDINYRGIDGMNNLL